jgi:hypothetical protein
MEWGRRQEPLLSLVQVRPIITVVDLVLLLVHSFGIKKKGRHIKKLLLKKSKQKEEHKLKEK